MSISQAQLAARLNGGPLLLAPMYVNVADAMLAEVAARQSASTDQQARWWMTSEDDLGEGKPYQVKDGVAWIPVEGMLAHKIDAHVPGWFTGYDYITNLVDKAASDPSVKGIALRIGSHGGEVYGCFECADQVYAARDKKPVLAVVDAYAHSAGYAIASAATRVVMPATGSVGSVGVITMHVDYSKMLAERGVKVTMLYKGKHKADGNPFEKLSPDARANIESRLDESYESFVALVARNRGIDSQVVRDTEARTFSGSSAVQLGLADAVESPRDAMASFYRELSGSLSSGVQAMTQEVKPAATTEAPEKVDANAIRNSERERLGAIVMSDEAKGREELANHLAYKTSMSADEAKALLAMSPKKEEAKAETPKANAFDQAMANTGNPEVGAGESAAAPEQSVAARVLANYAAATGHKVK